MIQKAIQIKLEEGLEARPVAMLVQVASQFESTVYINSEDRKVNAKSIMGMMSLGLASGDEVSVVGSHHQYKHPTKKGRTTIKHPDKDIPLPTLKRIEEQSGLTFD